MSEKMDGVRAYWNGDILLSRHGNSISCPEWFITKLPKQFFLDGELWMGPGTTYMNLNRALHSKNGDWSQMNYYIFDIPSSPGSYEDRMKLMESLKPILPPHIRIVDNTKCTGTEHLLKYLD